MFYPTLTLTLSFAAGSNTSSAVNPSGLLLLDVAVPSTWTLAQLFFEINTGGGWSTLTDLGGTAAVMASIAGAGSRRLTGPSFESPMGVPLLRARSGAPGSLVVQPTALDVTIYARQVS